MNARPHWRDLLARHASVLAAVGLFAASMLVARSFASLGGPSGASPAATADARSIGVYTGPDLTGVFVSCIPECDLVAVSTGIGRRLTQTDRAVDESAPSLSPDGTRVAFRCAEPGIEPGSGAGSPRPAGFGRICLLDIPADPDSGFGVTAALLEDDATDYGSPAWSPDGATIAFHAQAAAGASGIGVFDLATGTSTIISEVEGHVANPAWSPDGGRLAFLCGTEAAPSAETATRLCTMPGAGGVPSVVASVAGTCGAPSFTPDGANLGLACVAPGSEGGDLFLVSTAGGAVRTMTSSRRIAPEGLARIAWSPDERYAYVRSNDALLAIDLPGETWSQPPLVALHGDFDVRVAR